MANDQMFNPMNPMQAALLGPDILQKQFQMEQNRRYADLLQAQSMEPMQGQMVDGHYIAPSPVQGLANMLRSYVSRKTMDDLPKQMSELANAQNSQIDNMFGVGGGNVPQADASRMALSGGAQTGSFGPTVDNANRMNNVQSGTGSAYPIPAGMDGRLAATLYKIDPRKYAEALATHSTPTELMKTASAAGFQPNSPQMQQIMRDQITKQNYIAPVNAAPGSTVLDPSGRNPLFNAPKDGIGINYGPNGPQAFQVPGYGPANANIKGLETQATEDAKANYDLVDLQDEKGNTYKVPRASLINPATNNNSAPSGAGGSTVTGGATPNNISKVSPEILKAREGLPGILDQIKYATDTIDKTLNHPGLKYGVGPRSLAPTIPGTSQADFISLHDQIKGKTFMQAYQNLKGGGQITEIEGTKAENAIARLNRAQTETAYKDALNELKGVFDDARKRAVESAQMAGSPTRDGSPANNTQQNVETAPLIKPDSNGIYKPKTIAEWNSIPSGKKAYNDQGILVIKP